MIQVMNFMQQPQNANKHLFLHSFSESIQSVPLLPNVQALIKHRMRGVLTKIWLADLTSFNQATPAHTGSPTSPGPDQH